MNTASDRVRTSSDHRGHDLLPRPSHLSLDLHAASLIVRIIRRSPSRPLPSAPAPCAAPRFRPLRAAPRHARCAELIRLLRIVKPAAFSVRTEADAFSQALRAPGGGLAAPPKRCQSVPANRAAPSAATVRLRARSAIHAAARSGAPQAASQRSPARRSGAGCFGGADPRGNRGLAGGGGRRAYGARAGRLRRRRRRTSPLAVARRGRLRRAPPSRRSRCRPRRHAHSADSAAASGSARRASRRARPPTVQSPPRAPPRKKAAPTRPPPRRAAAAATVRKPRRRAPASPAPSAPSSTSRAPSAARSRRSPSSRSRGARSSASPATRPEGTPATAETAEATGLTQESSNSELDGLPLHAQPNRVIGS